VKNRKRDREGKEEKDD
jgi:hypothetical protein